MRFNIYIFLAHTHVTLTSLTICKAVGEKDTFLQITSPRNVIKVKEVYLDNTKK